MHGAGHQAGAPVADLCLIQARIGDRRLHRHIRVCRGIAHEPQGLTVDARRQVDLRRPTHLAAQSLRSGVRDLRRSALDKVKQGITSLIEINRVTKD